MIDTVVQRLSDFFSRDFSVIALELTDILLVALVFYYLLLLIKGTRAMQMGIGVVFVVVVYQFAKRVGLDTLFSMLDAMFTSLVLTIVVIFQHDIRRALMRFGQRPWFTAARAAMEEQVVDEVVKAAAALTTKRIGALIVFEREAMLEEFIEPGTQLDAAVTKELLYSIFIPSFENPMHDGAVIIRDGRIWQAGTFLPLTVSPKLDRTLGTRHRAAIGLTEETDAVVVVASEERGALSLCFNGNIVRNLDPASLRKVLVSLLMSRSKRRRSKGGTGAPEDNSRGSRAQDRTGSTSTSTSASTASAEDSL